MLSSIKSTSLTHQLTIGAFVALGLSGAENALYISQIVGSEGILRGSILRAIFSSALHVGATLLILRLMHTKKWYQIALALVIGVGVHTLFNLSLASGHTIVLFGTLILTYIVLTKPVKS